MSVGFLTDCTHCAGIKKTDTVKHTWTRKKNSTHFWKKKKISNGRDTHHLYVCALVESLCKNSHHKDVNEEGDEERHGRLDEDVFVGLSDFLLV